MAGPADFPVLESVPFEEAIAWAKMRGVVLPDVYYGELQGLARSIAFSVAGMSSADQLQGVLDSLAGATETGESFLNWQDRVRAGEVPLDLPDHRLDNIFRTNVQSHYARGRCQQHKETLLTHPWFLYDAVNDSRTRPAHAAMDGFVARHDDPVWAKWDPPNGYRCRCRKIAITARQAERFVAADQHRLADPAIAQARMDAIANGPDKGWDYSICEDPTEGVKRALVEKIERLSPALAEFLATIPPPAILADYTWLVGGKATLDEVKALGAERLNHLQQLIPPGGKASIEFEARSKDFWQVDKALTWWQEEILREVGQVRELGGALPIANKSGKGIELTNRVASKLPSDWIKHLAGQRQKPYQVIVKEKGRGYCLPTDGKIQTDSGSTAEHEWIHAIQDGDKNLDALFQEEHRRRTLKDKTEVLFPYAPAETGRPDKYVDRYTGREYMIGGALEVMSMAFQSVIGRDTPGKYLLYKMLRDDQELLKLVLGALFHYVA